MKPRVSPADLLAFVAQMKGKTAWQALADAELVRGYQLVPVGSVPWLPLSDWHPHDCVSLDGDEVRLVAIAARRPRSGALKRLLAAIDAAGLTPCIIAPMGVMPGILRRWGWEKTEIGSTFADYEDQWRPAGRTEARTAATDAAGTITPPDAARPSGGPVSREHGGNDG